MYKSYLQICFLCCALQRDVWSHDADIYFFSLQWPTLISSGKKIWISLKKTTTKNSWKCKKGASNSPPIINFANSTEVMSLENAHGYDLNDHLMTQIDHDPHDLKVTSTVLQADIYHYCLPYRK